MEWKDVKGYEGTYQINMLGEVKSLGRYVNNNGTKVWRDERLMVNHKIASGYWIFNAKKDNVRKTMYIHKCLAEAFIDNPLQLTEVNHKDHNKNNNTLSNLEWVTHQENMKKMSDFYGKRFLPRECLNCGKEITPNAKLCKTCIRKNDPINPGVGQLQEDRAVMSLEKMATKYGVSRATITRWLKKGES